jgi:ATP synthase in type III secretion protein N
VDGHVVLERGLAARGRYPAVDVTTSLSRIMDGIVQPAHRDAARKLREMVGLYEAKRDLVLLGAYARGSDKDLDRALDRMPAIEALLRQRPGEPVAFCESVQRLVETVK